MQQHIRRYLLNSLRRQETVFRSSIPLNPVDSIPVYLMDEEATDFLQGFYVTDSLRTEQQQKDAKILFAGRDRSIHDTTLIYSRWARALRGSSASLRLLSGLHAHVTVFMALGDIGDTVLLLPEEGGGHFATKGILSRLGYDIVDIPLCKDFMKIDISATRELLEKHNPDFLFVDRSEGLTYEDFSGLLDGSDTYALFDASHYLPQILCGIYEHPFDMGFHLIVTSLHKSFPGPQKALVVTRNEDAMWKRIRAGLKNYVSSAHPKNTYLAGLSIDHMSGLREYALCMLENSVLLERSLAARAVPIVCRDPSRPPTHHIWIALGDRDKAYQCFRDLQNVRILTNYRLLPYGLGYGLRLGTSSATLLGMRSFHIESLADCVADTLREGPSLFIRHRVRDLAQSIRDSGRMHNTRGNRDTSRAS